MDDAGDSGQTCCSGYWKRSRCAAKVRMIRNFDSKRNDYPDYFDYHHYAVIVWIGFVVDSDFDYIDGDRFENSGSDLSCNDCLEALT